VYRTVASLPSRTLVSARNICLADAEDIDACICTLHLPYCHEGHQCLCRTFMLQPWKTLLFLPNISVAATEDTGVCAEGLHCCHGGHRCLYRTFMLLQLETLVSVQNIYVATTGDIRVCVGHVCCYNR
jgi:hypothetical protein